MNIRNILIAAMGAAVLAGGAGAASANTPWQNHHPRRVEVNHRITHLNREVRMDRRDGEISGREAARLHARVHMVRLQERRDARFDHGHITRHEQARLNREEGGIHRHVTG